jgi:hypothetical protein
VTEPPEPPVPAPSAASGPASLDAAAASLRADAGELDLLLRTLADKLGAVPGIETSVRHRRPRWRRLLGDLPYVNDLARRSGPIESVRVEVGGTTYQLAVRDLTIACTVTGPGGTPALRPFDAWLDELQAAIDQRARLSQESLAALQQLIVYDREP